MIGDAFLRRGNGDVDLIAVVLLPRPGQGKRRQRRSEGLGGLLGVHSQQIRQLADGGLPPLAVNIALPFPCGPQGQLFEGAAHLDRTPVPEQPPHLPQNHRHGIGREFQSPAFIEAVRRLDQPHTAGLKQVVVLHSPAGEPLGAGMYQPMLAQIHSSLSFNWSSPAVRGALCISRESPPSPCPCGRSPSACPKSSPSPRSPVRSALPHRW